MPTTIDSSPMIIVRYASVRVAPPMVSIIWVTISLSEYSSMTSTAEP